MNEEKLEKLLSDLPTGAQIESFNNDKYCGHDIAWTKAGLGFGHITFGFNKETGEAFADTEMCSQETIEDLLKLAVPAMAKLLIQTDKRGKT